MAKKAKKERKGKKPAVEAEHHEIDAVKGFIVVMLLLIVALVVFIFYTRGRLNDYEDAITKARRGAVSLGEKSLELQSYLDLMKDTGEAMLMLYPNRFFGNIYTRPDIGIARELVSLRDKDDVPVRRPYRYTESSWDLEVKTLNREQAAKFLHGVESESLKARTIEFRLRRTRERDAPEDADSWSASFKIGYRVAGT